MGIRTLLEQARKEASLPHVDGDLCVHSLIEQASCQACVDACPRGAWILDDEQLGLDTDACDGCGLCRPACPQAAINHDHQAELRSFKGKGLAIVACERSGIDGEGVIPCLHALDLASLLQMQQQDVRMLLFTRGECADCERSRSSLSFDTLIENFQRLSEQHKLPKLLVADYKPRGWAQRREHLNKQAPPGRRLSRRGFFRGVTGSTLNTVLPEQEGGTSSQNSTVMDMLPSGVLRGLFPHVPEIDPSSCSGCDACTRVCPHQAIRLEPDPLAYHVDARRCSGCNMCIDICEQQAVSVRQWATATGQVVTLSEANCRACGAPFHLPSSEQEQPGLCRICAANRHDRNLYQVL